MKANTNPRRPANLCRRAAFFENRREREFYRYYEPIRALTKAGPTVCNLHDVEAVKTHTPVSSPDRALTAFCQLGALRLGTRRAMLFFFDSQNAYILAEATRTLSLQDDSVHEIEDSLWLGHSIIPRGFSVCEETVCKTSSGDQMPPLFRAPNVHIINDLEADTTFCDRPYVIDGPKARFYAGVPITTPKGINIGAYCCLDDKTRPAGLDPKAIQFLHDMAATVMTHLEMVRAKSEFERGTQMVTRLSAYVEGATSPREEQKRNPRRLSRKVSDAMTQSESGKQRGINKLGNENAAEMPHAILHLPVQEGGTNSGSSNMTSKANGCLLESRLSNANQVLLRPPIRSIRQMSDLREQLVMPTVRLAFDRAAQLMREAVDVNGVMFLDTTVGTFGGLVNSESHSSGGNSSDAMTPESDSAVSDNETLVELMDSADTFSGKSCHVLAQSFVRPAEPDVPKDIMIQPMTEKFLRALLRRFPRGKVWNFSQQGDASSDDESIENDALNNTDADDASASSLESGTGPTALANHARAYDSQEIRRLFPGVRSLAVIGLWNQNRGSWYAACVIWTYSPLRIFSAESELNFVSAWCDVIMAEVDRLEVLDSDRAKGDFISSISHELRSPLHGILGSAECLQEQLTDPFSITLASQVEICGRTLLDVIDHVLDYSKIGHFRPGDKGLEDGSTRRHGRRRSADSAWRSRLGNVCAVDTDVALDDVTEDIIQSSVYSFGYRPSDPSATSRKVAVILDIEKSPDHSWCCNVPLGAWKRICINLVGNALKYTDEGVIHISLKACPIPGRKRWYHAVFTIRDTGRGMSKAFLQNHLFKAFSQEDSLIEGTGLGMNLVAKIVKSLDGRIDVTSEKGSGTTVAVRLPVEAHRPGSRGAGSNIPSEESLGVAAGDPLKSLTIQCLQKPTIPPSLSGMSQDNDLTAEARTLLHMSMERICKSFVSSALHLSSSSKKEPADVYVLLESDLTWYLQQYMESTTPERVDGVLAARGLAQPIVIVCNSAISQPAIRARLQSLELIHVEYIVQPCTRKNMTSAILNCVDQVSKKQQRAGVPRASDDCLQTESYVGSGKKADLDETSSVAPMNLVQPFAKVLDESSSHCNDSMKRPQSGVESQPVPSHEHDYFAGHSLSIGNNSYSLHALKPVLNASRGRRRESSSTTASVVGRIPNQQFSNHENHTHAQPPALAKTGITLLLVDDNSINLQLLVTYATKQGHPRITANDGLQAVDAYRTAWKKWLNGDVEPSDVSPPQVILMDINMPVMNGFEATRQIRAFEQQHGLCPANVIALTGLSSPTAQQEAFSSGVDLFLTKPVRLKELTRLLDNIRNAEPSMLSEAAS